MSVEAQGKIQIDNEKTRVTEYTFAPGATTGFHRHEYDYVITPVTDGRLRLVGPDGKESFADLVERVSRTIDRLSEKLAGRNLIAVAHGGTIRAAIAHALRLPAAAVFPFVIDNCSLTRLDRLESGVWRVGAVNHRPWVKGADIEVERRPGWADGPPLS